MGPEKRERIQLCSFEKACYIASLLIATWLIGWSIYVAVVQLPEAAVEDTHGYWWKDPDAQGHIRGSYKFYLLLGTGLFSLGAAYFFRTRGRQLFD
jgi:hypothetical protein